MNIAKKIALNTIIQGIGKVGMLFLSLLILGYITRYLGPEKFGVYNLIFVYLSFFNVVADLGLYTSTVREISKDKNKADEIINNSITFRVILSVIVIFLAIFFSFFLYGGENNSEIRYGIALISITILFNLINTSMNAVFQANIKMGSVVISELSGRLVTLLLVILIINSGGGLYQILLVTAMGSLATALLSIILVRKFINIRPTINLKYGFALFRKSIPLALALLINIVYFKADTIIISLFRDNTEVGIYGLSYRLLEASLIFPTFFIGSLFPVIADYAVNLPHKLNSFIQKAFDLLVMASVPLMAGGIIVSEHLIKAVAGDIFSGSVFTFQILIAASPLIFINGLFGNMIIAKNREKDALWLNILALIFNLSLNIIFIPIYGFIAAAVVTLLSEIVIIFGAVYLIKKIYNFLPKMNIIPKVGFAAFIMVFYISLLKYTEIIKNFSIIIETLFFIFSGSLVYIIILYLLRLIDKDTIQLLTKRQI